MPDDELKHLLSPLAPLTMRLCRALALAILTYVLSATQSFLDIPGFVLAFAVFVFGASIYAARFAYFITLYLTILLLVDPSSWAATKRFLEVLAFRAQGV